MLRRLSDVTLGSLDKIILKIGTKNNLKEKKRKFKSGKEEESESEFESKEEEEEEKKEIEESSIISSNYSLRKSKGHWNLNLNNGKEFSESIEDLVIDLASTSNFDSDDKNFSEISLPSDLDHLETDISVDENEWTQCFSNELKIKSFEVVLWKTEDYYLIPLEINEINYWNDFYHSLMSREAENFQRITFLNGKDYLFAKHPDLTEIMRTRLINWIFEITLQFSLHRETIYSTQMLIDIYLIQSNSNLPRDRFQLLGLAALLISSKLEEIKPPNLFELVEICDETFTEQEIANFELEICGTLKWHLAPINLLTWSNFYFKIYEIVKLKFSLTKLKERVESVMDLIIHSPFLLKFKPSKLSAAIIFLCQQEQEGNHEEFLNNFKLITGIHSTELELEINWIQPYLKSPAQIVCHEAEKFAESLNDFNFDLILKNNKIALNFLKNQIKKESNGYYDNVNVNFIDNDNDNEIENINDKYNKNYKYNKNDKYYNKSM